jgi:hypothetical protein
MLHLTIHRARGEEVEGWLTVRESATPGLHGTRRPTGVKVREWGASAAGQSRQGCQEKAVLPASRLGQPHGSDSGGSGAMAPTAPGHANSRAWRAPHQSPVMAGRSGAGGAS